MCVCLSMYACTLHAVCLYSTARVCVLSSYSQYLGLAQHLSTTICTVFPLWSKQADALLVTARYKATCRLFDSAHFLQLESSPKQESWQKLGVFVCACLFACMYASLRQGVYVWLGFFLAFLYPIQEEAEFCVTLVY